MKTVLAGVGLGHLALIVLGMFNVVDYHICLKGPGECGVHAPNPQSIKVSP